MTWGRGSKYHNRRVFASDRDGDARTWDSQGEYDRYRELILLEERGYLSDLECQPVVVLSEAKIKYRPDFKYTEQERTVYEDFKGVRTDRFRMICKLWASYGPGLLRITGKRGKRIVTVQEIMPNGPGE